MIGNVYRGSGFRGLVDYLADGEGASLLLTNLAGDDPRDFARQVGEVRALYPRDTVARPVVHIPFRAAPGEDLTDEEWQQVAETALQRLGFDNSPFVAYLHDHGDGRHLHIATYRVDYDGRLVSDSNDRRKVETLSREFEERFGLRRVEGKSRITLTRAELERQLASPDRAQALAAIRQAVDEAASAHDTLRGFMTELARLGVRAELKVARPSGQLQGIRFHMSEESVVSGSKLGKDYSLAAICRRHDLRVNLVPDERTLVVGDVTRAELDALVGTALAPDSVRRTGSRYVLAWDLPEDPTDAQDTADLISNRLPHRFLSFSDRALGAASGQSAREGLAEVARALEPVAPPALVIAPLSAEAGAPCHPPTFASFDEFIESLDDFKRQRASEERIQALRDLTAKPPIFATFSEFLDRVTTARRERTEAGAPLDIVGSLPTRETVFNETEALPERTSARVKSLIAAVEVLAETRMEGGSLPESAVRREIYRAAMETVISHMVDRANLQRDEKKVLAQPLFHPDEVLAHASQDLDLNRGLAEAELLTSVSAGDLPRARSAAAAVAEASNATRIRLAELILIATSEYEKTPTEENHARLMGLERQRRLQDQIAAAPLPELPEPIVLLKALEERLLAAQDLHHYSPTDETASDVSAARLAYERLANHLINANDVRIPNHYSVALAPPDKGDLLATLREVIEAQKQFLATPNSSTAQDWGDARHRYKEAIAAVLTPIPPPLTRGHLLDEHRFAEEKLWRAAWTLEARPRDLEVLADWSRALGAAEASTAKLREFDKNQLEEARARQRQAGSDLAFYEQAYLRRPSETSERLWRLKEQEYLRATLNTERAELRLKPEPEHPKTTRSRRRAEVESAGREVSKISDKALLGLERKASNLARVAARRTWAKTDVGRTVLAALHPLQSTALALPGGQIGLESLGVAAQLVVTTAANYAEIRALINYAEIRAAVDMARNKARSLTLEQGNLSSRALARALFKHRVPVAVPPPAPLRNSVLASRQAEANLIRTFRSYQQGLVDPQLLHRAAANALAARGAVSLSLQTALGLPTPCQVTAIFGKTNGRAATALVGGLESLGLSSRAIALTLVETAPALAAAGLAAGIAIGARQIVRFTSGYTRDQVRRLAHEQHEPHQHL